MSDLLTNLAIRLNSNIYSKRREQARRLRLVRKIHRTTGIILFILLFFVSITGIFLGWKKNSCGIILPKTQNGSTSDLSDWLPLDMLHSIAIDTYKDSISSNNIPVLDKMDVRKEKGIIKFVFDYGYWGIQLDGATGEVLQIQRRWSDLIENIHDGSILDDLFGTKSGTFKLLITSSAGLGIIIFIITGFWLWYVPRKIRRKRKISFM
jgi:uncharacterized iron-regulated membrane protein